MATFTFFLLSLFFFSPLASMSTPTPSTSTSKDFIVASCRTTRYPPVCVQSLAGYAGEIQQNAKQLAQTALKVSLSKAKSASVFITKMAKSSGIKKREYQAIKDCIYTMSDSVDRLGQSVKELGQMGDDQDFVWHMSNVQTWTSAALTDENTCMDGFSGRQMNGNVKISIRRNIVKVAQVTSNALALVNRFASRHKPAGDAKAAAP